MRVHILTFGILKDWLGSEDSSIELEDRATVADLLERLAHQHAGTPAAALRGIAVSVNAEYAVASRILCDGDEVGLLPPVSGGTGDPQPPVLVFLTRDVIDAGKLVAAAK